MRNNPIIRFLRDLEGGFALISSSNFMLNENLNMDPMIPSANINKMKSIIAKSLMFGKKELLFKLSM